MQSPRCGLTPDIENGFGLVPSLGRPPEVIRRDIGCRVLALLEEEDDEGSAANCGGITCRDAFPVLFAALENGGEPASFWPA
jgi:hypothetical protein